MHHFNSQMMPVLFFSCAFPNSLSSICVGQYMVISCFLLLSYSFAKLCLTLCDPVDYTTPAFSISWSLLKLMSMESVMPSNRLILCHPLLLLPSIFPSIRVFSNDSVLCIRWPKYWSFSYSISPSHEYSELISFRMDWLDLLTFQESLKSLLQQHSLEASVPGCSAFFMI